MSGRDHPCTGPNGPAWHNAGGLLSCTACGAYQRLNPETRNLTWIRNGRVIAAVQDLADAKARHDTNWGE